MLLGTFGTNSSPRSPVLNHPHLVEQLSLEWLKAGEEGLEQREELKSHIVREDSESEVQFAVCNTRQSWPRRTSASVRPASHEAFFDRPSGRKSVNLTNDQLTATGSASEMKLEGH